MNTNRDILKKADGTTEVIPVNNEVIGERKFSLAGTTDKMGITNAGRVTKGFIWGAMIVVLGIAILQWTGKAEMKFHFK
jgi:hypothetical protein